MLHILIHALLAASRAADKANERKFQADRRSVRNRPERKTSPPRPAPEPAVAKPIAPPPAGKPIATTPSRPDFPRPTTPVAAALAAPSSAFALTNFRLHDYTPRGEKGAPKAKGLAAAAKALENVARRDPKLARFAGDVAQIETAARGLVELHEEHDRMPSKQRRHEIAALEKRIVRELEHYALDMKETLKKA